MRTLREIRLDLHAFADARDDRASQADRLASAMIEGRTLTLSDQLDIASLLLSYAHDQRAEASSIRSEHPLPCDSSSESSAA